MTLNDSSTNKQLLINFKQKYVNNIEHIEVLKTNASEYNNQDIIQNTDEEEIKLRFHDMVHLTEIRNINDFENENYLINDKKVNENMSTTNTKSKINLNKRKNRRKPLDKSACYEETVKCIFCSFVPKNQTQLGQPHRQVRVHMHKVHFVCKICEKRFDGTKQRNIHFDRDHKISETHTKCAIDYCSFTTKWLHTMFDHVAIVHKGIRYACDEIVKNKLGVLSTKCGKSFSKQSNLYLHKQNRHSEAHQMKEKKPCTICGKILIEKSVEVHMKYTHGDMPTISCTKCSYSSKYHYCLKVHEKIHMKIVECPICHVLRPSSKSFNIHFKSKHEQRKKREKIWPCSTCDFKADIPAKLVIHEQTHGPRTFKCETCNFLAKTKTNLGKHQQRHKDPKYLCHECDYKTYDSANFKCHTVVKHGTIISVKNATFQQNLKEH